MAHDRNGKPLKNGDEVILRGTVEITSTSVDFCNVLVRVPHPTDPNQNLSASGNSRCCELVETEPADGEIIEDDVTEDAAASA
ncbi:MAG: hypothetical protein P4L84_11285 [Isosphaeraceae bacterium]|nr:hypothetical protein [Isosphaeraceae bacterium]